jgi:hypothetical protein
MTGLTKHRKEMRELASLGEFINVRSTVFTALLDALDEAERERDEARALALEEAAEVASLEPDFHEKTPYGAGYEQGRNAAATRIRMLKDRAP